MANLQFFDNEKQGPSGERADFNPARKQHSLISCPS